MVNTKINDEKHNKDNTDFKNKIQENDIEAKSEDSQNYKATDEFYKEDLPAAREDLPIALRREKREIRKPDKLSLLAEAHSYLTEDLYPQSYNAVMKSHEAKEWQKATDEEMTSLAENNTWELVSPPKEKKII